VNLHGKSQAADRDRCGTSAWSARAAAMLTDVAASLGGRKR
jgi:hypothetical protein